MFDLLDPGGYRPVRTLMSNILNVSQQFERTDPKDSVYAVLGLIDHGASVDDSRAALLEVDYTKSLASILRDATRYALLQILTLKGLHGINHQFDELANPQRFPTWTFRADVHRQIWCSTHLPPFSWACEGLEAPSLLDDVSFGEDVLLLEGVVIDEVLQSTIACVEFTLDHYKEFQEWLVSVENIVMHQCNIAMQENIHLAIAFTLVAGKAHDGNQAQPEDLQMLVDYIKSLTIYRNGVISNGMSIEPSLDRLKAVHRKSHIEYCGGRRFFLTTSGRMGIGPRCMRPGDIVVVLRGGQTPFILRKKVDGYWLLGPAYVHGVMYGEAVQIERDRGRPEVVFPVW